VLLNSNGLRLGPVVQYEPPERGSHGAIGEIVG
jgi:hypothetical protein